MNLIDKINLIKKIFLICIYTCTLSSFAMNSKEVAKAIILKGEVSESYVGASGKMNNRILRKGDSIHEGAQVKCGKHGFVKLLFFDKSQMMVSPNSSIEVKSFTQSKPGMINLLKGRIRSKVTKNRMELKEKNTSKLFIKTKTAAMGVRGTDFQVIFNPKNRVTSLLTFEGAVAMTKINSVEIDQKALEMRLNSNAAVMVRRGQYSGSLPGLKNISMPVKISPAQLEALRGKDEVSSIKNKRKARRKSSVRSTIAPGLNAKKVATKKGFIIEKMADDKLGVNSKELNSDKLDNKYFEEVKSNTPAEGSAETKTSKFAAAAGGFIDAKTGLYIPPSKGDAFDADAGVYIPSPDAGSIDLETGDYIAPEGTILVDNGSLIKINSGATRSPASLSENNVIKNVIQNELMVENSDKEDLLNLDIKTPSIDLNDYQRETVIKYNDNTQILDSRTPTSTIPRGKVKINIKR